MATSKEEEETADDDIFEMEEEEETAEDGVFEKYLKGYWREFSEDYLEIVEKRCHDLDFCGSGMLGPHDKLVAVLEQDELTLQSLGVTRHQIADVLETIQQLAPIESENNTAPILGGRFKVRTWGYCGIQGTPFYHPDDEFGTYKCAGSQNIRVTRVKDGATFSFATLLIDLIRYNGFFEGPGVGAGQYRREMKTFRLDPKLAVEFFHIKPGVNYALRYENRVCWSGSISGGRQSPEYEQLVQDLALKRHTLSNGDEVFLSWLPMVFDPYVGFSDPVDPNKFVMEKLMSMPSPEAQIDYLIECKVGTVRDPEDIAKVRKALQDMRSNPEVTGYTDALALETFRETKHDKCVETVFGADYERDATSRDFDWYEMSQTRPYRKLVEWDDSIGL